MKRLVFVVGLMLLVGLAVSPAIPARAQAVPSIVDTTIPIAEELRAAVNAWLAVSPPSSAIYYAMTYVQPTGLDDTYASIVALNISGPDQEWSIVEDEDGQIEVIWMGTVLVHVDGSVDLITEPQQQTHQIKVLAMPVLSPTLNGAGGGAYVRFPWQASKAVRYGILGVHSAGYSQPVGTVAVDLVSGSDFGSGAANDSVYASVAGTVDFVCEGTTATTVRVTGGDDSFIYAHLIHNANLAIGHAFSQSANMGTLVHGSFTDSCGYAVQTAEHWHLHWGFIRSGSDPYSFQAEGCILTWSTAANRTAKWTCGPNQVKPNEMLTHYGGTGNIPDDGGITEGSISFFTLFTGGLGQIFEYFVGDSLPEHTSTSEMILPIMNSVKVVFRIVSVLLKGNFNLAPAMAFLVIAISINLGLKGIQLLGTIMRIIKGLPGMP